MSHVAVLVPGIWNTKKRRADPSFGDSSLFHPTSPSIHSFPLLSKCCLILTVSIFSRLFWEQSVLDSVNVSREKRCRKGENYHMSLFFLHFTLGAKCLGFFSRFMWEKISIRRELPHVTLLCISLLDTITVDQYHIITMIIPESS